MRYAAVNGAITVLRQGISHVLLDPSSGRCTGVTTSSGQRLQCEALVANALVLRCGLAGCAGMGWDKGCQLACVACIWYAGANLSPLPPHLPLYPESLKPALVLLYRVLCHLA